MHIKPIRNITSYPNLETLCLLMVLQCEFLFLCYPFLCISIFLIYLFQIQYAIKNMFLPMNSGDFYQLYGTHILSKEFFVGKVLYNSVCTGTINRNRVPNHHTRRVASFTVTWMATHFDWHRDSKTHAWYLHLYQRGGDHFKETQIVTRKLCRFILNRNLLLKEMSQKVINWEKWVLHKAYYFLRLNFGMFSEAKSKLNWKLSILNHVNKWQSCEICYLSSSCAIVYYMP